MDVTHMRFPGLFKRGGFKSLNNREREEWPGLVEAGDDRQSDEYNGYVPEQALFDRIRSELFGAPMRGPETQRRIDAHSERGENDRLVEDAVEQAPELGRARPCACAGYGALENWGGE